MRAPLSLTALFIGALLLACEPPSPLAITEVAPPDGHVRFATPVTLTGTSLAEGALVFLTPVAGPAITLEAQVDAAGTEARVMVPAQLAPGAYDLALENPDGTRTAPETFTLYDGALEVTVIDVGQGDSTLVRSPRGDSLIMDGGPFNAGRDVLRRFLGRRGAYPPDFAVVSHRDADHLAGLVELFEGADGTAGTEDDVVPARLLLDNGPDVACTTRTCERYDVFAAGRAQTAEVGQVLRLGGGVNVTVAAVNGEVLGGQSVEAAEDNARSVALLVEFGEVRMFIGGDLTGGGFGTVDVESVLAPALGDVDVLRVSHHGSATSTNDAFVRATRPEVAFISVGRDNPHCHPDAGVLSRLQTSGARIFLTEPGIVTPGDCDLTRLPTTATVAEGHLHLRSEDGQGFTVAPLALDGSQIGEAEAFPGD